MPTVVVTARSRICVWAVPDHPGGPACRGRSCRGTTCPVGAVVVALVSRLGVLVTGTSAGRIVGRRTRVSCFRRATRPRVARPSGFDDGGRLLQSCCAVLFTECRRRADTFTLNKLECSKQAQIWRGGFTAVSSKGPEYWSHGIMEQDLGPAHLRPSRAREIALRGVSVRGPPGRGRQSPARPAGPVFGTGVGGAICLVNSDNERDSVLLTRRVNPGRRGRGAGGFGRPCSRSRRLGPVSPNAFARRPRRSSGAAAPSASRRAAGVRWPGGKPPVGVRQSCVGLRGEGAPCSRPSPVDHDTDRGLQFFHVNEEFPVSASHQLALITSLPFVHTARRYYRLNDRSEVFGLDARYSAPSGAGSSRDREDDRTRPFRGSKSRNKVSVGEPAEGSLETGPRYRQHSPVSRAPYPTPWPRALATTSWLPTARAPRPPTERRPKDGYRRKTVRRRLRGLFASSSP
ncbi:hypothetical protein ACI65C_013152 [Semiaphis heraclei]